MSSTSLWSHFKKNFRPLAKTFGLMGFALLTFVLAGCDNPQKTIDTLRVEIKAFKTTPDEKKQLEIEQNFAKLETQVETLQRKGDARAESYANELTSLRTDYQAAKMAKAVDDAKKALEGFGNALKDGVKSIGDAFHKETNSPPSDQ